MANVMPNTPNAQKHQQPRTVATYAKHAEMTIRRMDIVFQAMTFIKQEGI